MLAKSCPESSGNGPYADARAPALPVLNLSEVDRYGAGVPRARHLLGAADRGRTAPHRRAVFIGFGPLAGGAARALGARRADSREVTAAARRAYARELSAIDLGSCLAPAQLLKPYLT